MATPLLLAAPRAARAAEAGVDRGLLAETLMVAYGERPCDGACSASLARRLAFAGPGAALCAEALLGRTEFPRAGGDIAWVDILGSHWPVFELLQRNSEGLRVHSTVLTDGLADLWFRLLPGMKGAVQRGWRVPGLLKGFQGMMRWLRHWPGAVVQAELLLQVATALRFGMIISPTTEAMEPPPKKVLQAGDWFIARAQRLLANVTAGAAGRLPERVIGLLVFNERMRISLFDVLRDLLPPRPSVVFAGAHTGAVVRVLLDALGDAKVYAFEADPFVYSEFADFYRREPRVEATHAALFDRDGVQLEIRTRDGIGSQSTVFTPTELFKETWPWVHWGSTQNVSSVALEPWARRKKVAGFDFVYLDIECAELKALKGLRGLLRNVTVVHLEVSTESFCEGGPLWPEVKAFLRTRGFQLLVVPERPWEVRLDVTAVRWPLPARGRR